MVDRLSKLTQIPAKAGSLVPNIKASECVLYLLTLCDYFD